MAPIDKGDGLVRDALARIESKLDRIESENSARFGNIELRLSMIEGMNVNTQASRKETANRAWAAVFSFALPVVGCITWLITTVTGQGYTIQQHEMCGTAYGRKVMDKFEARFAHIEGKIRR